MLYYTQSVDDTLDKLGTSPEGLSDAEAAKRLKQYGPNTIRITGDPLWRKLIEPFANVFMLVLFVAAVISVWHHALIDAALIIFIMLVSAIIYYIQRFSTERILRSLQKHATQRIEVIRGGQPSTIEDTQLVPGDIVVLREGDKVPADLRVMTAEALRVDEAVLTGESLPVEKQSDALSSKKEVYEQSNTLFQGSFVIGGQVRGIVIATGNSTEFGRLAALTKNSGADSQSPVQKKIDKLLSYIIAAVGGLAIVAFALAIIRGTELTESIRFVLALSVSAVPESLPVAISVVLVLGMRRMAAKKALVRTMRSIETVGVLTTIATDKTGTLTENKLTVQEVWQPAGSKIHLATVAHRSINHHGDRPHDPLDVAMIEYTAAESVVELKGDPLAKLPFDQAVAMSGNIWQNGRQIDLTIKGAPEQVLARSDLTKAQHTAAEEALQRLTSQGYRVIALATTPLQSPVEAFADLHHALKFEFVGFMAVADTLRPEARRSIAAALKAGVTVRMITGDHFETAYHIGKQLGLVESRDQVFDSRRMSEMKDKELRQVIQDIRVFSRVIPENKYRILELLKVKNVTAMTGDGVNDVPALASAHVGVAMGSGSQIAKDAGDIILLNDNFKGIIDAMKEGRIIFANIRRMLFYLLSTNTGEALTMVGALIVGLPIPLLPVQILWINLVTDTAMVIPLGLEPGEKDVMKRRPISPTAPILSWYIISRIVLVALAMAAVALGLYAHFNTLYGSDYARTIAFSALVVMQWANAFNARSTYQSVFSRLASWNRSFYIGLIIAVGLQLLAILGPLGGILHIQPVATADLVLTGVMAFSLLIILVEAHKLIGRAFLRRDT